MLLRQDAFDAPTLLGNFLSGFSTEVVARDSRSLDAACDLLPSGTEVFVAFLPKDTPSAQAVVASRLRRAGLVPVPHVVARHLRTYRELDESLARFAGEAGVNRVLILAGDKDRPVGELDCSLDIIRSGLLSDHGMQQIFISCYPEGHPRISEAVLDTARHLKIQAAQAQGLQVSLVSQFCFEADPILALASRLRDLGSSVPLRVGVAGPADRATLIRYGLFCGVGASMRALTERPLQTSRLMRDETPEQLLSDIAAARRNDPSLLVSGAHFFTFASLDGLVKWMNQRC